MSSDSLHRWLSETGLESAMSVDDRALMERTASVRPFQRGQVLWLAGSPSRGLFAILEGRVRVLRARNGRQHLVHVSGPGETMGEVPLFDGGGYPATAIAASDGRALRIPGDTVRALVGRNGAVAALFAARLSGRVRGLIDRLEGQTLTAVRARLAASLVGAAAGSEDGVAAIPGTQEEWAEDLGTVREVLARELKRMKEADLLQQVGPGRFVIQDEEALEAICG